MNHVPVTFLLAMDIKHLKIAIVIFTPGGSLVGARTMTQPPVDIGAGVGSLYSPDSTASREMQAMRDRIAQLEAQLTDTPPSPKDSGFQTPREIPVVNNLIDLDPPPRSRVPKEEIEANDLRSRMMMPPVLPGPFEHQPTRRRVSQTSSCSTTASLRRPRTAGLIRDRRSRPRAIHLPPHSHAAPARTTTSGSRR